MIDSGAEELVGGIAFALRSRRSVARTPLPLAPLLDELDVWASSALDESWKRNRDFLREEVEAAERVVGESLRTHLGEPLRLYLTACHRIFSGEPRENHVEALKSSGEVLRALLAQPDALTASWNDLETAVIASDLFAAIDSALQLEAQLDLSGRDGRQALDQVTSILLRDARSIGLARHLWGDGPPPDFEVDEKVTTSVPPDEVIRLAEQAVIEEGRQGHVVVWSLYDRAFTTQGARHLGPLTVYMPQWIIAAAFEKQEAHSSELEEIRGLWHARSDHERGFEFSEHVLVRIDLGMRSPVGALDAAEDLVETLMDALISTGGGGRWGKARWSEVLMDGEDHGSRFGQGSRHREFADTLGMEEVEHSLAKATEGFAPALLSKTVPWHLREALRTCAEASRPNSRAVELYNEWHNDDRTIVLLLDAAFEHLVAFGQTTTKDLSTQIEDRWPWQTQTRLTLWIIDSCLHPRGGMSRPTEEAKSLESQIRTRTSIGSGTSLLVAYRLLDQLTALAESPLQAIAVKRIIGQLGDSYLHDSQIERIGRETTLLASRRRRVRNAIAHGNPVTRQVLDSVIEFSQFRTVVALQAALDSFAEGTPLKAYLTTKMAERGEDDELKRSGMSQVEIWESRGL